MAEAKPLQIESVVDRVYEVIRARILDGELPRGVRLRQEALAKELGVSRTPLREALRRLAAEGFVRFHPNRGAEVASPGPEETREAYEARLVLEPGAARLAALNRPARELAAMRAAIEQQRRAADPASALRASRAFHLALVRAGGNDFVARFAEVLWAPGIAEPIFERYRDRPSGLATDLAEHEAIALAVEAGDEDLAERLTRRHIEAAARSLLAS